MKSKKILLLLLSIFLLGLGTVLTLTFYNNQTLDGTYYSLVDNGKDTNIIVEESFITIDGEEVYYQEVGRKESAILSRKDSIIKLKGREYSYIHNLNYLTLYLIKDSVNESNEVLFFRKK